MEEVVACGFCFFMISAIRAFAAAMSSAVDRLAEPAAAVAVEGEEDFSLGRGEGRPLPSALFLFFE